jgi:hypothetical protein
MPEVSTEAMQIYLDEFAKTIAPDEHVLLVLDRAGWHGAKDLKVPDCMTLEPLAAAFTRTEPSGTFMVVFEGEIPFTSHSRRLYRHRECDLRSLEPANRRNRPSRLADWVSLDHGVRQKLMGTV